MQARTGLKTDREKTVEVRVRILKSRQGKHKRLSLPASYLIGEFSQALLEMIIS